MHTASSRGKRRRGLLNALLWTAALATVTLAVANCVLALVVPTELELREGTVWLQVLAQSAGISIYDHTRVAFINMNHGPLDPLVKAWIHALAPVFPAHLVTRFFVGCLPIALLALYGVATRRWLPALLGAGVVHVFLLGFGTAQFLIGGSDPTALVLLCVQLGLGEWLRGRAPVTKPVMIGAGILMGCLAAGVVAATWRFAPVAGAVCIVYSVQLAFTRPAPIKSFLGFTVLNVLGALGVLLGFWTFVFGGQTALLTQHFFGIFTRESGWGLHGRMPFELMPDELTTGRMLFHVGLLVLVVVAVRSAWRQHVERTATVVWIFMTAAAWSVTSWAFARNHGGGGIYYFAPLYLFVVTFVTRLVWRETGAIRVRIVGIALVMIGLPWADVAHQAVQLRAADRDARRFVHQFAERTHGAYVYSEDVHLFRKTYAGEVIDMSDTVSAVAATGYFGADFTAAVQRKTSALLRDPPEFVLIGYSAVISPSLTDLLAKRYTVVLESGPIILAEAAHFTLYQLRHDPT